MKQPKRNRMLHLKSIALACTCALVAGTASASLTLTVDKGENDTDDIILSLFGPVDLGDLDISKSTLTMPPALAWVGSEGVYANVAGDSYDRSNTVIPAGVKTTSTSVDVHAKTKDITYMFSLANSYSMIDSEYASGTDVTFWTMTFDRDEWESSVVVNEGTSSFGETGLQEITTTVIPEPTALALVGVLGMSLIGVRRVFRRNK